MKTRPFYHLSEENEKELFNNSIIIFDTSSLLDFYFFTDENINELEEKFFKAVRERLYLTYQSHFEFLKNKDKVKMKPIDSYNSLLKRSKNKDDSGHIEEIENVVKQIASNIGDEIKGHLKTFEQKVSKNNKHPHLKSVDFNKFNKQLDKFKNQFNIFETNFEDFKQSIIKEIENQKTKFKNHEIDKVIPLIENYFNVTEEYSVNKIFELIKEGEFRYQNQIPPGYMDKDGKSGFQKYGDLIIWDEILNLAKGNNSNVILVINDVKEDWWYLDENKKHISPRYELIKEFKDNSNKEFWMYDISTFLFKANNYIATSIDSETIEEIRYLTEENTLEIDDKNFMEWVFDYFETHQIS